MAAATAAGRDKKMLKSLLAAVLLSPSVERVGVSRMRDFLLQYLGFLSFTILAWEGIVLNIWKKINT